MVKIALVQIDPVMGDFEGNIHRMVKSAKQVSEGIDLVVFPEMSITGYPPRDLLFSDDFICRADDALRRIESEIKGINFIAGTVRKEKGCIFNSAAVCIDGKLTYHDKTDIPEYDVFNEKRYFTPACDQSLFELAGRKFGITICEDIWVDGPVESLAEKGADIIINISASPYHFNKDTERIKMILAKAKKTGCIIYYCNAVGGQDDLIFDGNSIVVSPDGLLAHAKSFSEDVLIFDSDDHEVICMPSTDGMDEVHNAIVLGIRDYFSKNNMITAVLGISGGIDSAVCACLAAEALGTENILLVAMPGPYSSGHSLSDAKELADKLGVNLEIVDINEIYDSYMDAVDTDKQSITSQNIQARIRGNILMAIANENGGLVIATGNKSEIATGYCTLYGDMAGAVAPIGDLYKGRVYQLADFMNNSNEGKELIPSSIIKKTPSAELKTDQKDSDSLPEYDILDKILHALIEENKTAREVIDSGYDQKTVKKICSMIKRSEFKRNQGPIILRVSKKAFGSGRLMPVTLF